MYMHSIFEVLHHAVGVRKDGHVKAQALSTSVPHE